MRHRVRTRRLGVRTSHRKAMMRNMVTSLMEHGRIVTTITRAKELRRLADRMVTLGKDGSLHARRQALSVIRDRQVVAKLFEEWSPRFADRNGGYTRIVRLGPRRGDATMMAVIELAVESLKPGRKKQRQPEVTAAAAESVIPAAVPEAPAEAEATAEETVEAAPVGSESAEAVSAAAAPEGPVAEEPAAEESIAEEASTELREAQGEEVAVEASAAEAAPAEAALGKDGEEVQAVESRPAKTPDQSRPEESQPEESASEENAGETGDEKK